MRRGRCSRLPAQFTVEAALLMTLILPMLAGLILAGFFVHDRAFLQGIACEGAVLGSAHAVYEDGGRDADRTVRDRVSHGLLWTGNASSGASANKKKSSAAARGNFRYILSAPFLDGRVPIEGKWERRIYRCPDLIRKVRGAQALLKILEEKE